MARMLVHKQPFIAGRLLVTSTSIYRVCSNGLLVTTDYDGDEDYWKHTFPTGQCDEVTSSSMYPCFGSTLRHVYSPEQASAIKSTRQAGATASALSILTTTQESTAV